MSAAVRAIDLADARTVHFALLVWRQTECVRVQSPAARPLVVVWVVVVVMSFSFFWVLSALVCK
jgi:hypothetical protein